MSSPANILSKTQQTPPEADDFVTRLRGRALQYVEPFILLSISLYYLPLTLLAHPFLLITAPGDFRSKWFEAFWVVVGPKMAQSELQAPIVESLLSRAYGTVLELGPGAGDQCYHYKSNAGSITKLYGAEPNVYLHKKLLDNAANVGLKDKVVAMDAGAQPSSLLPALRKEGLIPADGTSLPEKGVFDTIITVKSMCSAPSAQMAATIAIIHALLKPGGEFLFFEHVGNDSDKLTQIYVWFVKFVWLPCMGGCRLTSKLDKIVQNMGGWQTKDIRNHEDFKGYEVFRYVTGICKKEQ